MLRKFILLAILVFGAVIRFWLLLENRSLWWDETAYFQISQLPVKEIITGNYYAFATHPWLIFLILKIISSISTTEIILRLPSTLAGIIVIYIIYLLIKTITENTRIALLSSFLFSLSAYHVFQSIHAKGNEIILLFQLISILYLFYYLRFKRFRSIFIHFLFLFLSLIISYYTIWYLSLLFFIFIFYIRKKIIHIKSIKISLLGYLLVFTAISPWFFLLLTRIKQSASSINWVPKPNYSTVIETINLYFGFKPVFIYGFWIITVCLFLFLISRKTSYFIKYLLTIWLVFPIVIAYIFSIFIKPIFIDHYLLFSSVAIYIIIAILSANYKWTVIFFMIFLIINFKNNLNEFVNPTGEDWRGVVREIYQNQMLTSQDYIITDDYAAFNYYVNYRLRPKDIPNMIYLSWTDSIKKEHIINRIDALKNEKKNICLAVTFISYEDIKKISHDISGRTNIYPQVLCLRNNNSNI